LPTRRGAIGFALAWAGFEPLYDYRRTKDIFGREFLIEQTNIADALAAAAVLVMGEGKEQTPLAILRDVPHVSSGPRRKSPDAFQVPFTEDLFAPLLLKGPWKKGGSK
jgi:F420-0:gamma-glutamyl ligase